MRIVDYKELDASIKRYERGWVDVLIFILWILAIGSTLALINATLSLMSGDHARIYFLPLLFSTPALIWVAYFAQHKRNKSYKRQEKEILGVNQQLKKYGGSRGTIIEP